LAKQNESLDVYLKQAQANSLWNQGTKEALMRYGQLAQEIIDAEPEHPTGYRLLSWYHYGLAGYGDSPQENLNKAFALSRKTLAMDESNAYSHALSGYIYRRMRKYEKAIEAGKRSVELQPNGAFFKVLYGNTLNSAGRVDEGIAHIKQAIRLNPFPAYYYYSNLGLCYLQKGQYEDALKEFKKALQRAPEAPHIHSALATTYILLDREEEARASAAKSMELAPYVSVSMMSKTLSIKNQAYKELILDAMRKAGFPE
jgi:tetratricopeptide (TPR) repeat protein